MVQSQTTFVNHTLEFSGNSTEEYDLEDLLRSEAELLGKGTFGFSYKAELGNGKTVAVKRLKDCCLPEEEFKQKIQELAKLSDHQSLLPLRAYYYSKDEKLLIFDYMPMSSLASLLLHDNGMAKKASLTWEIRTRIAYGVARALEFLHAQGPGVCHGNIRSSNVLLTNCFDVRLSENGIFRLFVPNSKFVLIPGYQAPEVENAYDVSVKSDVYSFGVLLLELLTGKAPLEAIGKNSGVDLPSWVRDMFQEKPIIDVFDSMLLHNYQNFGEQMVQLLQLAICCTFKNPSKRPSMVAVTNRINRTCSFRS
ncbi:putative inactive receptor kinase RLK902 [Nicotiana tabacum]|uniref:Inactive receptor kinase RLK902 n=1 Tax=Nicotiana tabacum TaxID=4097 RepID=A0A1S3ZZD2_TOBAC|nr:probable inactive receptor kinase RLK902 [Nicotiana tomentosiformis]XP_016469709.1 PREDICTED: probable inactive receptor kinase RLK902 [Nicotiana tabacum]